MAFFIILLISGCSIRKIDSSNKESNNSYSSDIYKKVEMQVPSGKTPQRTVNAKNGGAYVVCGEDMHNEEIWHIDAADNWTIEYEFAKNAIFKDADVIQAYISREGEIFVIMQECANDELEELGGIKRYFLIDENGENRELTLDDLPQMESHELEEYKAVYGDVLVNNCIIGAKFYDNGIYAIDRLLNVYEISKIDGTYRTIFKNEYDDALQDYFVTDKTLVAFGTGMSCYEGIENDDNEIKLGERLTDFFTDCYMTDVEVCIECVDDKIIGVSKGNMKCIDVNSDESSNYRIVGNDIDDFICSMTVTDEKIFAVVLDKATGEKHFSQYALSKNIETVNCEGNEKNSCGYLKIWLLEHNYEIEQIANNFMLKHPEISVEIEVGLEDWDNAKNYDDAIKSLNTSLVAGDGPDIIYLDNLPIDNYVENSYLYDMTELIDGVCSDSSYFENIINSFKESRGLYAVPASFWIVAKAGEKEAVEASRDYRTFVEYIERKGPAFSVDYVGDYIKNIYYRDIHEEISEGIVDREKVSEYFELSKRLCKVYGCDNMEIPRYDVRLSTPASFFFDPNNEKLISEYQFCLAKPYTMFNKIITSENRQIELLARDFEKSYFVKNIIGINAKSNNIEIAKKYIEYVLDDDTQIRCSDGISVNIEAFITADNGFFGDMNSTNTDSTYEDGEKFDRYCSQREQFINQLSNMNRPIVSNIKIEEIVFNELERYIREEINKDDAVNTLVEKIELYKSE